LRIPGSCTACAIPPKTTDWSCRAVRGLQEGTKGGGGRSACAPTSAFRSFGVKGPTHRSPRLQSQLSLLPGCCVLGAARFFSCCPGSPSTPRPWLEPSLSRASHEPAPHSHGQSVDSAGGVPDPDPSSFKKPKELPIAPSRHPTHRPPRAAAGPSAARRPPPPWPACAARRSCRSPRAGSPTHPPPTPAIRARDTPSSTPTALSRRQGPPARRAAPPSPRPRLTRSRHVELTFSTPLSARKPCVAMDLAGKSRGGV
jgi:hypothetical protein